MSTAHTDQGFRGDLTPPGRRPGRRRPLWVRRLLQAIGASVVILLVVVGWSIGGALTAPGTDSTSARLAEWGRDHGFNGPITWLEKQQYEHNQPRIGGAPTGVYHRPADLLQRRQIR